MAASHVHLQSLAMSNCSSANLSLSSEQVQPANLMLERLGQAQRLSYLDVSMNRLDLSGLICLVRVALKIASPDLPFLAVRSAGAGGCIGTAPHSH